MGEGAKRMGMEGSGYGAKVDSVLEPIGFGMSREDWLRLAWACVDQASGRENVRLAQRAREAIEDMFDAEPETQREGTAPDPVKLSREERGMLLEMPIELEYLREADCGIVLSLIAKGLVVAEAAMYVLTESGKAVAQMAGAT
jgi:hypothetical protein